MSYPQMEEEFSRSDAQPPFILFLDDDSAELIKSAFPEAGHDQP